MIENLILINFVLTLVNGWSPTDTCVTFGTGRVLGLPVDGKLTGLEAHLLLGLPAVISPRGANEINAIILLAPVQELCVNIASIDEMLPRQQVLVLQSCMDARCPRIIEGTEAVVV